MKLYQLLIVLVLGFAACKASPQMKITKQSASTAPAKSAKIIHRVDNQNFAAKIASSPDAQVVDVRTPEECTKGVIKNAININYRDRDFAEQANGKLDKNKPVMLYCAAGGRSAKAANILKKQGFKEIYELKSGYGGWK